MNKIDWIETFEKIDISKDLEANAYIITTDTQKKKYFKSASFNLTLQYLHNLKKNTYYLDPGRILLHINSQNIERPTMAKTESSLFNNTVFEAQNNYFEFLESYKEYLKTNPMKHDIGFMVELEVLNNFEHNHIFKNIESEIKRNGFKTCNDAKIYTAELATLLITKELKCFNMEFKHPENVNGLDYLTTFIKAYHEGVKYFEDNFSVSINNLYGEKSALLERLIHDNYYHVPLNRGLDMGWGYVKRTYPMILSHAEVRNYGYYSGVVSKVDEMRKIHSRLFAEFEKCDQHKHEAGEKNNTNTLWFTVGLMFANGEMAKLLKKHNNNFTQISKELSNKNLRPYISETFNNNAFKGANDKNIYNDQKKLMYLHEYCTKNNIPMENSFLLAFERMQAKS